MALPSVEYTWQDTPALGWESKEGQGRQRSAQSVPLWAGGQRGRGGRLCLPAPASGQGTSGPLDNTRVPGTGLSQRPWWLAPLLSLRTGGETEAQRDEAPGPDCRPAPTQTLPGTGVGRAASPWGLPRPPPALRIPAGTFPDCSWPGHQLGGAGGRGGGGEGSRPGSEQGLCPRTAMPWLGPALSEPLADCAVWAGPQQLPLDTCHPPRQSLMLGVQGSRVP